MSWEQLSAHPAPAGVCTDRPFREPGHRPARMVAVGGSSGTPPPPAPRRVDNNEKEQGHFSTAPLQGPSRHRGQLPPEAQRCVVRAAHNIAPFLPRPEGSGLETLPPLATRASPQPREEKILPTPRASAGLGWRSQLCRGSRGDNVHLLPTLPRPAPGLEGLVMECGPRAGPLLSSQPQKVLC